MSTSAPIPAYGYSFWPVLVSLASLTMAACEAGPSPSDDPVVVAGALACTTDPTPTASILSSDEVILTSIAEASFIGDSSIAVVDSREKRVFVFDLGGTLLTAFGSEGPGPGEFKTISQVRVIGDTLEISDNSSRRVTLFNASGEVLATRTIPKGLPPSGWVGPFRNGNYMGMKPTSTSIQRGFYQDTVTIMVYDSAGTPVTALDTMSGTLRYVNFEQAFSVLVAPFTDRVMFAAHPTGVVVGSGRNPITAYGTDGSKRTWDVSFQQEALTRADIDATYERIRSRSRGSTVLEEMLAEYEPPATAPLYDAVHADETGSVWVSNITPAGDQTAFEVRTLSGAPVEMLSLPGAQGVEAANSRFLLTSQLDSDGVPFLTLYKRRCSGRAD